MTVFRQAGVALAIALAAIATSQAAPSETNEQFPGLTGRVFTYTVVRGDTLGLLSARFGVPPATLASLNQRLTSATLKPGEVLTIDNRHIARVDPAATLTLSLAQRMLFVREDDFVRGYPVAVGRSGWQTPTGVFTIVEKETNPTWDVPESIQEEMRQKGEPVLTHVPPGPDNPLGAFFLRLSFSGVGLHGTNAPSSIYRFTTHGCVRLSPGDIADLYARVQTGTTGMSIYEPVLMTITGTRVWLEVHPDVYRRGADPRATVAALAAQANATDQVDWTKVAEVIRHRPGIAIDVTREGGLR